MKTKLLNVLIAIVLISIPALSFAQAPPLGTASDFILFSTVGAITNTGISQLTGNVGTNSGSVTGFGNINGVIHENNGGSGQCAVHAVPGYGLPTRGCAPGIRPRVPGSRRRSRSPFQIPEPR